jgi:hypothetical protein
VPEQESTLQGAEELTDPKPQSRTFVRYPTLRKPTPSGFLNVDRAIDTLGATRFPSEWGIGDVWKALPFRQDPASKRFIRYKLVLRNTGGQVATDDLASPLPKPTLKTCHRIFSSVRKELANALIDRQITASKLFCRWEHRAVHCSTAQRMDYANACDFLHGVWTRDPRGASLQVPCPD